MRGRWTRRHAGGSQVQRPRMGAQASQGPGGGPGLRLARTMRVLTLFPRAFLKRQVYSWYMTDSLPMTVARAQFGSLVRRASLARERITITDHGQPAAILINPQELADLEDALALAEYRNRQTTGTTTTMPNHEVRALLGLTE